VSSGSGVLVFMCCCFRCFWAWLGIVNLFGRPFGSGGDHPPECPATSTGPPVW
jgi:hypothetical protein